MTNDTRINIRISEKDKAQFEEAAKAQDMSLSKFMIEAARRLARRVAAKERKTR